MDRPDPALAEGGGGKRGCQQQRGENLLSQFRPVKKSKLGSFGDYLKRSTESSRGAWVLSRVQARTIPPEAWPSRPPCGLRGALRLRLSPGNPSWAKGIPKFINLDCIFFSSHLSLGCLGSSHCNLLPRVIDSQPRLAAPDGFGRRLGLVNVVDGFMSQRVTSGAAAEINSDMRFRVRCNPENNWKQTNNKKKTWRFQTSLDSQYPQPPCSRPNPEHHPYSKC